MEIQLASPPTASAQATPSRRAAGTLSPDASEAAAYPTPPPKPDDVKAAVADIQKFVEVAKTNVTFTVDHETGRTIVSVVDSETKQIVRQIPAADIMKLAHTLDRLQGLLFSGKA